MDNTIMLIPLGGEIMERLPEWKEISDILLCGSLNVIGPHNLTGNATIRRLT